MENNKKYFRTLNFDLSDEKLKQYYPKKNIKQAWDDIEKYLTGNGFNHRQYSGYLSNEPLYEYNLLNIANKLFTKMPWIINCATKFDTATVTETFDLLQNYLENCSVEDLLQNNIVSKENPSEKNREDFLLQKNQKSVKQKTLNDSLEIKNSVKMKINIEQATRLLQSGITFSIISNGSQERFAVFDKSNAEKVNLIIQSKNKSRGR